MPFRSILIDLVSSVEGAEGAIFLDAEGEAVQWYAKRDDERLRLRAAYVAVTAQSFRVVSAGLNLGRTLYLMLDYEGAKLLVQEVESGYFIMLELSASANLGQALYRIKPAVARLRSQIAA